MLHWNIKFIFNGKLIISVFHWKDLWRALVKRKNINVEIFSKRKRKRFLFEVSCLAFLFEFYFQFCCLNLSLIAISYSRWQILSCSNYQYLCPTIFWGKFSLLQGKMLTRESLWPIFRTEVNSFFNLKPLWEC